LDITEDLLLDPVRFLEGNPYNARHHAVSAYGVANTIYYGKDLNEEQLDSLIYAGLWHAPAWGIHVAHKMGAFASHSGGFGYYRSMAMFPTLGAIFGYFTIGREVMATPMRTITYTAGDDTRFHYGGGISFRNPISGM
jgi:hypothetical protein